MERRVFIKLLGIASAAVGLGVKGRPTTAPPTLPPTTLQAAQLDVQMDSIELPDEDGWRRWAEGQQTATWTVRLEPDSPWVEQLELGTEIDIELGTMKRGLYRGRAIVQGIEMTPNELNVTLMGTKAVHFYVD